jgi:hypothetical protein
MGCKLKILKVSDAVHHRRRIEAHMPPVWSQPGRRREELGAGCRHLGSNSRECGILNNCYRSKGVYHGLNDARYSAVWRIFHNIHTKSFGGGAGQPPFRRGGQPIGSFYGTFTRSIPSKHLRHGSFFDRRGDDRRRHTSGLPYMLESSGSEKGPGLRTKSLMV